MAHQFAEKLRLTAKALGCVTQKELCARFLEVNPQTQFELGNSYKWISGRAQPRSGGVFDDWARVLDLERSGRFLADCPLEEFRLLLAGRYEIADDAPTAEPKVAEAFSLGRMLQGSYAVYSLAWSKAARGSVIRGWLEIEPGEGGELAAQYSEQLPGGALTFSGRGVASHRALHFFLEDPEHQSTLFLCCHTPTAPGNALLGLMAGSAYHDPESRPMAVRMLCVRNLNPSDGMASPNRYLGPSVDDIQKDIRGLGYHLAEDSDIGELCASYLSPGDGWGVVEVPMAEVETLIMRFDYQLLPET